MTVSLLNLCLFCFWLDGHLFEGKNQASQFVFRDRGQCGTQSLHTVRFAENKDGLSFHFLLPNEYDWLFFQKVLDPFTPFLSPLLTS